MAKYRYTGKDNPFVNHGDIVEGVITTWSVKKPVSSERGKIEVLYLERVGFNDEDIPIYADNLELVSLL